MEIIMDYEQKYKEALKKAKAMIKVAANQDEAIGFANTIFPELAESEDERIRKTLICGMNALKEQNRKTFATIPINDCIAWLEKQGESTDINPSEFDLRLNKLLKQFETLPKEELASSLSFYLNVVQNNGTYKHEEKQGEQKPAYKVEQKFHEGDWVVVSTAKGDRVVQIASVEYSKDGYPSYITTGGRWFGNVTKARLLTDKDVEIVTIPESRVIKSKSSWSEEDERKITDVIVALSEYANGNIPNILPSMLLEDVEWLKSLKERCTWKPSDEQMDALHYVTNFDYGGHKATLVSLYEQLKKLKG